VSAETDRDVPALAMRGIDKSFGDLYALRGVKLEIARGAVHALLGENGAGKSTLMRIAFGMLAPDAGNVELFGRPQSPASIAGALAAGVGMVHQHLSLVPNLSVLENLVLGGTRTFSPSRTLALLERTEASAGLTVPRAAAARDLSIVEQQRLEILKALSRGARLLILDEPTAVLAPREIDDLLRWLRNFAAQGGSAVFVTHKLREALAVADHLTVLRRGAIVHTGAARDATADSLARIMFGATVEALAPIPTPPLSDPVAELRSVTIRDDRGAKRVRGATLVVRRHEIVGIAAVEGSGHRDLLAALAGLRPVADGDIVTSGRVAFIPADRLRDAIVPGLSLTENVALRGLGRRRGLMNWKGLADDTEALIRRYEIAARGARSRAGALSGGNQQRLVVARELESAPDLVVADNPTRGLDVRASAFVHARLREAAARGAGVVVHSSDIDEVLALATRVVVMFQGETREVPRDRDAVGRAMLGAA
jgi:general nucleoside transport system ATP-binding protein